MVPILLHLFHKHMCIERQRPVAQPDFSRSLERLRGQTLARADYRACLRVCACFPPKVHDGTLTLGCRICSVTIETTSCAVNAEGHSNATVKWSEHSSPLSGSLN